ncbi:hypothetical protein QOZ94_003964 [Xanthobacter agilis]|uniref:Transposase n=1 Tax=Xanthobacter agilis TaxID=47492 RepID=A0ABU0LJ93_XANAG|nr:hypothetical protein [Xanthobacter agilis]
MQRHRHQDFIRFLNARQRDIPPGRLVHVILDNYTAHKGSGGWGERPTRGQRRRA